MWSLLGRYGAVDTEVFINYRGAGDSLYAADALYAGLTQALGPDRVFLDSESIKPGADFVTTILDKVRGATVVLSVIGPHWSTASHADGRRCIDDPNDWIRRELAEAFNAGVPVVPILTDNATMPTEADLPADIAMLGRAQYALLRQRHVRADIGLLLDRLTHLLPTADHGRGLADADPLSETAEQLARAVGTRWRREEEHHRIRDPFPLPVRWKQAPPDLTDHWENIRDAGPGVVSGPLPLRGRLDEIVHVYRQIPSGRLVVLGQAGSGKTILALRFVLDFLKVRTGTERVPVIFTIGSWNPTTTGLRDWLAGQLVRDHPGLAATGPGNSTLATALIEADRILPVLDGFDELADGLHRAALTALNEFSSPLLLTSRHHDYAEAVAETDVLTAAAGIQLTDLTLTDLADYLPRTTRKTAVDGTTAWDHVLHELREHPGSMAARNLTTVLSTPLMVALARTIYSDTPDHDPSALLDTDRFSSPEAVADHLLANVVPTAYRHHPPQWDPDRVEQWLGYLAGHLKQLGTHNLAWWEVGTTMRHRSRMLVVGLVAGLAFGLVDGLVAGILIGLADKWGIVRTLALGLLNALVAAAVSATVFGLAHGFGVRWLSRRGALEPSRVRIRIRGGARHARHRFARRLIAGFLAGFVFGSLFYLAGTSVSGMPLHGWVALWNALLFGITLGLVAGPVLGLTAGLEAPIDIRSGVSPTDLLTTNRTTVLVQVLSWGLVFLLVGGPVLESAKIADPAGGVHPNGLFFGIVGGLGGGLGYAICLTAWGQWIALSRIWLPLTGQLPWALPAFLEDAYQRGVLRRAGSVYQFRHARLQDHLAHIRRTGGRQESAGLFGAGTGLAGQPVAGSD